MNGGWEGLKESVLGKKQLRTFGKDGIKQEGENNRGKQAEGVWEIEFKAEDLKDCWERQRKEVQTSLVELQLEYFN